MRVGIVGCGLIGHRRARMAVAQGDAVVRVADVNAKQAETTGIDVAAHWTVDWRDITADDSIEAVVVATPNAYLCEIAVSMLEAGKHVLCEKPLGRNGQEARAMVQAAERHGVRLKTGFNHRHHPAVARAHELAEAGDIGPLLGIRAAYGHGGRPGYDQEWRGDAALAGGGELLDQGVHLVDLCRWFLGDFSSVSGAVATWYWDVEPLEDNGFALLRTSVGQVATLHSSWTQWKNLFRFEIFGRDGYLLIQGLGGSYGPERLVLGRRRPESGPPDETVWEFAGEDRSWELEWTEFSQAIAEDRRPIGDGRDGLAAALLMDAIYASARKGAVVAVEAA